MSENQPVPRFALVLAGTAVGVSLCLAGLGRMTGGGHDVPVSTPVLARSLLFKDQPGGAVAVFDAADPKAPIARIAPETNGFLRATMRGLAQQRLRQDAGQDIPFRLTQWRDGRLTLEDPTTGRSIEMEAFGSTNEAVFAKLLIARAPL